MYMYVSVFYAYTKKFMEERQAMGSVYLCFMKFCTRVEDRITKRLTIVKLLNHFFTILHIVYLGAYIPKITVLSLHGASGIC